jgi:hypothetical protein
MGMTPDEFWDCTPFEFGHKMAGFFERDQLRERQEWERVRWQTCLLINTQTSKTITPQDLITFEWEREKKTEETPITLEEMERIKSLYN